MLQDQIEQDLKAAMREKNEVVLSALRNLKAAITNSEIEKKTSLSEDEVLSVIAKKVKQHKDSIESFLAGSRTDLADHEKAQLAVLQKYLPKQMEEAELARIIKEAISAINATSADFGKVMKEVTAKVRGRADGSMISKIVKEQLK